MTHCDEYATNRKELTNHTEERKGPRKQAFKHSLERKEKTRNDPCILGIPTIGFQIETLFLMKEKRPVRNFPNRKPPSKSVKWGPQA